MVEKKEFAATALDPENETFVIYIATLTSSSSDVHHSCRVQVVFLKTDEALTAILNKYIDFVDVFLPDLAAELLEYIGINDHAISLINGKQPLHRPIYSIVPVELKTLKFYIETNLANDIITPIQSLTEVSILFV